MIKEILKTSDVWRDELYPNVIIYDADGWNRQNYQFSFYEEKITRQEFENRLMISTCMWDRPEVVKEIARKQKEFVMGVPSAP